MEDREALPLLASLAPANQISGGRLLSSRTRRSCNRVAVLRRIAAINVGKTDSALGASSRRLAARLGKATAVTATARKIAVLFGNTFRPAAAHVDPGAGYDQVSDRERVLANLRKRARSLGFDLVEEEPAGIGVSQGLEDERSRSG